MATTLTQADTGNRYANEQLILGILKEYYPELDSGAGTPFYELAIRPNSFLWSKHSDGIKELLGSNTFADVTQMSPADLDRLMTRHFEQRKTGQIVYGVVRIVLNTMRNYSILANTMFQVSGNRTYFATQDTYISQSQLLGDPTSGYVVDIQVKSEGTGNAYNAKLNENVIPPQELNPYVLKCFFAADTTDGGIQENNKAFFDRVQGNVSLKNLTTYRGTRALLRQRFNIRDIVVVGLRDPEMRRDLFELPSETGVYTVHRGSHADMYVRNDPYVVVSGYQAPLGFPYSLNGVSIADEPESLLASWNALNFKGINTDLRGSSYEVLPLSATTKMSTLTSSIKEIQTFVSDMDYEAIHSDNIVRQMWPIVVRMKIRISDANGLAAAELTKDAVVAYINSLSSGMYPQVGNVINAIKQRGVSFVHTPLTIDAYYIKENLVMEKIGLDMGHTPDTSLLVPLEPDSLMFDVKRRTQMSIRTCFFYTNRDLVKVEVV